MLEIWRTNPPISFMLEMLTFMIKSEFGGAAWATLVKTRSMGSSAGMVMLDLRAAGASEVASMTIGDSDVIALKRIGEKNSVKS
jgi:hypothetical protein